VALTGAERAALYRERHPDRARQTLRQSYYAHRDARCAYGREYYWKHRDDIMNDHVQNPQVRQGISRRNKWRLKKIVMNLLGGKCVGCGITDLRLLCVNHKNGGGTQDRKNSNKMYREIRDGIRDMADYDIRCCNCNVLYEYERGTKRVPIGEIGV
jgi:hypothetical protein